MEDSIFTVTGMQSFGAPMFGDGNLHFDRQNSVLFCPNNPPMEKPNGAVASPSHESEKLFQQCVPSTLGSSISNGVNGAVSQRCIEDSGSLAGGNDDMSCVCKDCGKKFTERSLLLRHRVVHAEAKYVCEFCQRAFVRDDKLKRHIRCVHSHERPFVCEVCAKAFARKDKLQEHARHHNRDITFPCPVCPDLFVMRSHLNRHLRTVHNLKYTPALSAASSTSSVAPGMSTQSPSVMGINGQSKAINNNNNSTERPQLQTSTAQFTSGTEMVLTPISTNPSEKRPRRKSTATKRSKQMEQTQAPQPQDTSKSSDPLSPAFTNPSNPHLYASAFSAPTMLSNNGPVNFPTNFLFGQPNVYQTLQQQQPSQTSFVNPSDVRSQLSSYSHVVEAPQQQQQQQQQQLSSPQQTLGRYEATQPAVSGSQTQSALSAAMAASLLAPVNYVGWWHQSNPSLMLPYAQSGQLGSRGETKLNTSGLLATDSGSYGQLPSGVPNVGNVNEESTANRGQPVLQLDPSSTSSCPTPQPWLSSGSGPQSSRTAQTKPDPYYAPTMSYPSSAQMLASLNPFAQAMYYQAATLAATQNGQPVSTSTTVDPSQSAHGIGDTSAQVAGSSFPFS